MKIIPLNDLVQIQLISEEANVTVKGIILSGAPRELARAKVVAAREGMDVREGDLVGFARHRIIEGDGLSFVHVADILFKEVSGGTSHSGL